MYKNHYFYLLLIFLFLSCKQEKNIPTNILDEDKIIEIITQLEINQAYIRIKTASFDSNTVLSKYNYNIVLTILKQNNTTKETFNNSINYYASNPKKLEEIYTQVVVKLSEKQANFHAKTP